jgi:excisionase family DNA binding protein
MSKTFLTSKEAAEYLDVTIRYFYYLSSKQLFKAYKPSGKKSYYKQSDLDNYITSGEVEKSC